MIEDHPALERAVEAEIARVLVVHDEEAVVARVACLADGEAGPRRAPPPAGVGLRAGGHHARGRAATSSALTRRSARAGGVGTNAPTTRSATRGCRDKRHARNPEALERRNDRGRGERTVAPTAAPGRSCSGAGQERRHGRAGDAGVIAGTALPGDGAEPLDRPRCEPDCDRSRPTRARRSSARRG